MPILQMKKMRNDRGKNLLVLSVRVPPEVEEIWQSICLCAHEGWLGKYEIHGAGYQKEQAGTLDLELELPFISGISSSERSFQAISAIPGFSNN